MQMSFARDHVSAALPGDISYNNAYAEGWANYAERLADEENLYLDAYPRIQRRAILGRSLVLDPGINSFRWTRSRAVRYVKATGLTDQEAEPLSIVLRWNPPSSPPTKLAAWKFSHCAKRRSGDWGRPST